MLRLSAVASTVLGMDVIAYLLDSDPVMRWQVMRDLTDASTPEVAAERARVATEGWGARLLAEQAEDGLWDGGVYRPGWVDENRPFYDAWTGTHPSLEMLRALGVDPAHPVVTRAIARVRENVRWDYAGEPYFEGEVEPCINGGALANAAYFGQDVRSRARGRGSEPAEDRMPSPQRVAAVRSTCSIGACSDVPRRVRSSIRAS